jgi:hypothetical protein
MTAIKVPKPPRSAYDPDRPVSSLLKMQMEHLLEAEKRLPIQHHSGIYINAVKTEREAAAYIRAVTDAIHNAHAEAEQARLAAKRKIGLEIAAVANAGAERKRKSKIRMGGGKQATRKKKR